jgi:hypothetical protein
MSSSICRPCSSRRPGTAGDASLNKIVGQRSRESARRDPFHDPRESLRHSNARSSRKRLGDTFR